MTDTITTPRTYSFLGSTSVPMGTQYRLNLWENEGFYPFLAAQNGRGSVSSYIWREAQALDVLHDAYKLNESPIVGVDTGAIVRRDNEAALRQAELLGATADQRRKLRTIVEERAAAQREVDELKAQLQAAQAPITDKHDERIRQIFVDAAEEANRQGYCSVYDQISAAVGIPTREELKVGKAGHVHVNVTIRVPVDVDNVQDYNLTRQDVLGALREAADEANYDSLNYEEGEVCED